MQRPVICRVLGRHIRMLLAALKPGGCIQGTGTGWSLDYEGSEEVKLAHAAAFLCLGFRIPNLPDTVHASAVSHFATPVHLAGIHEPCVGLTPVGRRAAGLV